METRPDRTKRVARNARHSSRLYNFALTSPPARGIGIQGAMLNDWISLYSDFIQMRPGQSRTGKELAKSIKLVRNTQK